MAAWSFKMSFSGENSVIPLSDSDQEIGESRAVSYDPRWGSDRVKASYIRPYHTLPRILWLSPISWWVQVAVCLEFVVLKHGSGIQTDIPWTLLNRIVQEKIEMMEGNILPFFFFEKSVLWGLRYWEKLFPTSIELHTSYYKTTQWP